MANDLDPPIADRPLPPEVAAARVEAEERFREASDLKPAVDARVEGYLWTLNALATLLRVALETSDLDLGTGTRAAALWQLSARSLSLGLSLVTQVGAGFGVECYATGRSINETTQLIRVFCHPEGDVLLRLWLRGGSPPPRAVGKALARIELLDDERRAATGLPRVEVSRAIQQELYGALSGTAHSARSSTDLSVSHALRTVVIGPSPDWGMRAYFVAWAGAVVGGLVTVIGQALQIVYGSQFYDTTISSLAARLAAVDAKNPLPENLQRRSALEFYLD